MKFNIDVEKKKKIIIFFLLLEYGLTVMIESFARL